MQVWHTRDKSDWPPGPWQREPDKCQWMDESTDYPCLALRNAAGAWCGYVGVGPGHPAYEQHYYNVPAIVHGGLTYSDHCQEPDGLPIEELICHVVDGEDRRWWLGFDCAHRGDYAPGLLGFSFGESPSNYRDLHYVMTECQDLAAQLAEVTLDQLLVGGRTIYWRADEDDWDGPG